MNHVHNLWHELHHNRAAILVLLSLWILACVVVYWPTVLWWPRRKNRGDRRPRWYKPRHRAQGDEHPGATADWSPAGEQDDAAPVFTPFELLPSHVVKPEVRTPDLDAVERDVHEAFGFVDDEYAAFEARVDALVAAMDQRLAAMECPGWDYSRREQDTGRIDRRTLKALLAEDDDSWTVDITQRFPVLEVTAT